MRLRALLIVVFPCVLVASPAAALDERGYWVIEHVTILARDPGAPEVIEDGTAIFREGLIVAVGKNVRRPDDLHLARRLDGTGLVLHPAFIDALTSAGVGRRESPSRSEDEVPASQDGPIVRTREARRTGTFPDRRALDVWNPDTATLDRHRRHGFAACLITEDEGLLPGATSLVSLAGGPLRDNVIAPTVSQRLRFHRAPKTYPVSLMGAVAHLRQTFLDARHHTELLDLYKSQRRGLPRPPFDTALEALVPVLAGSRSVFAEARTENELRRALRLAAEFRLGITVTGARRAYRVTGALRQAAAKAVLVADLGEKPVVVDKNPKVPLRVQRFELDEWEEDARGAAVLSTSGVPYAYGSGRVADPEELLKNVRLHVEYGLDERAALRALSLGAAEILGVADILGSVEVGKVANVVLRTRVGDGDGFSLSPSSQVRYVFVDGVRFEYEKVDDPPDKKEKKSQKTEEPEKAAETSPETTQPPGSIADIRTELDTDRKPAASTHGTLLIRDATVLPCDGTGPVRGDVRIVAGKIESLGQNLQALEGMEVLNASGLFVMPGIVDCHSHIAIDGGVNESTQTITAEVRVRDVLDPGDVALYRALAGGVTTSNLLHGSANTVGGQNCVIRHRYRAAPEELPFAGAPEGIKFALGENPRRSNAPGKKERFPASRMGVEAVLRRAFEEAREYRLEVERNARAILRGERALPLRRDLRLEALLEVLEGRRWVHTHCYRADEILMMLDVAKDYRLRLATLQHVLEGYKVAPEIAAAGVGASTFSDWWAYKLEAYDAIPQNAAVIARAGAVVSINSDDPELVRHLNHEAAKMVRSGGLGHEEALQLITRNPARQLGIDDRVGTVAVGKDADLAIFDAHPLSIYARCRYTLIEGEIYFERRDDGQRPRNDSKPLPPRERDAPTLPHNPRGLFALRGGRVTTVSGPVIEAGTLIFENGRIRSVGKVEEVAVPEGATVVDVSSLHVFPGFIDAGSALGLTEISSVAGSVDRREIGEVQPDLLSATAVNAHSALLPVTRAGGVTSSAVFFEGPLIAGQGAWIRLAGTSTEELIFRRRLALHVDVPGVRRGDSAAPPQVAVLEDWFRRGREYREMKAVATRTGSPAPPVDLRLEALEPYVRRDLPVVFTAQRESQIRLVVDLASSLKVRAILSGGRDAWKVAGLLREKNIPVIVGPVHDLPSERYDPYDSVYANPGRLVKAGVPIAFRSDEAALARNLPYHVGTAVAFGLPYDRAVEALTLGAAKIFGVDRELGSLEVGKLADVIVTDGDPFEPTSRVLYLFIDGKPVSVENRHTRLYKSFRDRVRTVKKRSARL